MVFFLHNHEKCKQHLSSEMDLEMTKDKVGTGMFPKEERQPWALAETLCAKTPFGWDQGEKENAASPAP